MPREVVHWMVLDAAAKGIDAPAVRSCLERHRSAAMIGAVLHDAPYYDRFGASPFEKIAEWLHGRHGEDTFQPLCELAAEIQPRAKSRGEAGLMLWAALLGMVSHLAADVVFHPMVFYLTGDYYASDDAKRRDARARHRALEVYLDSWCVREEKLGSAPRLRSLWKSLPAERLTLMSALDTALSRPPGAAEPAPRWRKAFRYQAHLQSIFLSPALGAVAALLRSAVGEALIAHEALFSYKRREPPALFDGPIEYRNPVTGSEERWTLRELTARAAADCRVLFMRFEPLLQGTDESALTVLGDIRGGSLSFGIPGTRPEDARFYSAGGLPLPELEITG